MHKSFGAYQVIEKLGEGGMGQVYRAHDDRLNRDVAVKVLPDAFSGDADRLARFSREAQALGALNHPNIAQIYGIEDAAGAPALVMEFVDGPTLADLIRIRSAQGTPGVPVAEVIDLAREMAAGLEAAHEKGIIHRDLKPANVKVTSGGRVKILDFGLAKALAGDPTTMEAMHSPTLTARATEVGIVLGTAAYMSPEQARGRAVDKRADIWGFGAVVFELLAGERAFAGDTVSDTLASVLKTDPDWSRLPAETPPFLRRLLRRCLERDPSKRLRDIGEARVALEQGDADVDRTPGLSPTASAASPPAVPARPASWFRRPLPWIIATTCFAVSLALWAGAYAFRKASPIAVFDVTVAPPDGAEYQIGSNLGSVVVSPDGQTIAFIASTPTSTGSLWIRSLDKNDAHPLPETGSAYYPFWSPDSRRLGFFADGKMKTIDVASGLPEVVADASSGRGASWSGDGTIVFTPAGGGTIVRVPARGGAVTPVTHLDPARGENAHYWPIILPGDKAFLYFVRSGRAENNGIYLANIDGSGTPTRLVTALSSGLYAPGVNGGPGHLLWVRDGNLIAQTLDLAARTLVGPVSTIASQVRVDESQRGLLASVSRTGVLAWADARAADMTFVTMDRDGRRLNQLPIEPGQLYQPSVSPNGSALVFMRAVNGTANLWLSDLAAGTTRQLTSDGSYSENPNWSPDGKAISYYALNPGRQEVRVMPLDGVPSPLTMDAIPDSAALWTPDGRFLLFAVVDPKTADSVWAAAKNGKAWQLSHGSAAETPFEVSPDGRWLVVSSRSASTVEDYVTRLIADGDTLRLGTQRLTLGAFVSGFWRRDGREILAESIDGHIVSIPVTPAGDTLTIGKQTPLFKLPASGSGDWAPTPDGSRFIVADAPKANGQSLHVLTDWTTRLGGAR